MPSYGFRIRFLLPQFVAISSDEETLEIRLTPRGDVVTLAAVGGGLIQQGRKLTLRGNGYASEEAANTAGRKAKDALLLCGARFRMGIDVGEDVATSGVGKVVRDMAEAQGIRLMNDVHGLSVFPEDKPVRFVSGSASVTGGTNPALFADVLGTWFQSAVGLTEKQRLALTLYNLSHFEFSPRARFVTLITAVECLAARQRLSGDAVAHIQKMIDSLAGAVFGPDADALSEGLQRLKRESTSSACRRLVADRLGEDDRRAFANYYNVRSKLVHNGRVPVGTRLEVEVPNLDMLVAKLLLTDITSG